MVFGLWCLKEFFENRNFFVIEGATAKIQLIMFFCWGVDSSVGSNTQNPLHTSL